MVLVVPGRLDARTGGSLYNRHMADALRRRGWLVDVRELRGNYPRPDAAALDEAARTLAALPSGVMVVVDGMALSAMPDIVEGESSRLCIVALVHLPIAADVELDDHTAARFEASERRALEASRLVVVTGEATIPLLARYALPADRVVVVEPGTHPASLARGSVGTTLQLLCVATITPGKGHDVLVRALAACGARADWRLTCAGSLTRDRATAAHVRALVAELGLEDRVSFVGDLDAGALERCYDAADLFVLATRQETFGMAVAEALAHGLPVVSTGTGAIPTLVGQQAGLLAPPGDVSALTEALARAIGDADLRARLAAGARHVRERLPTWDHAAGRMAAALEGCVTHG
jgi:glycosyltransferase involved in cell wall biosynthesis